MRLKKAVRYSLQNRILGCMGIELFYLSYFLAWIKRVRTVLDGMQKLPTGNSL